MDEKKRAAMEFLMSAGDDESPKKEKKRKKEKKDKVPKDNGDAAKADVREPDPALLESHAEPSKEVDTSNVEVDTSSKREPDRKLAQSTLYEEDVVEEGTGHRSVWGSFCECTPGRERWGYACCHSFARHEPCPHAPVSVEKSTGSSMLNTRTCYTDMEKWEATMEKDKMNMDDDAMGADLRAARRKRRVQEFEKLFVECEREEYRQTAAKIELAKGKSEVELPTSLNGAGIPLRLFTRREDSAWEWAGKPQHRLDGGGDSADEW